jgi:hypothetical protein
MLIGHIEKQGRWWVAECEIVGAFTQGRSRTEAMKTSPRSSSYAWIATVSQQR